MPEVICTTVYQFPELSDAAKEKARSWYRELGPHDDWWDAVYDDFERVCEILGIRLKTTPVRLMGGGTRAKPCIWFSGFWSQSNLGLASVGFDAFNLAAIAIAVEAHGHMGDARGSQAIEEALLVGRTQSCDPRVALGLPGQHGGEINPGRRHRRG